MVCIADAAAVQQHRAGFVTNDGAIEAADRAFVELAENLSTLVEAQRNGG